MSGIDHAVETAASIAKWRRIEVNHPNICRSILDRPLEADRDRWREHDLDLGLDHSHRPRQEHSVDRIYQKDRGLDHLYLLPGPMTSSHLQPQTVLAQAERGISETIDLRLRPGLAEQEVSQSWERRATNQVSGNDYRILLTPAWKTEPSITTIRLHI